MTHHHKSKRISLVILLRHAERDFVNQQKDERHRAIVTTWSGQIWLFEYLVKTEDLFRQAVFVY